MRLHTIHLALPLFALLASALPLGKLADRDALHNALHKRGLGEDKVVVDGLEDLGKSVEGKSSDGLSLPPDNAPPQPKLDSDLKEEAQKSNLDHPKVTQGEESSKWPKDIPKPPQKVLDTVYDLTDSDRSVSERLKTFSKSKLKKAIAWSRTNDPDRKTIVSKILDQVKKDAAAYPKDPTCAKFVKWMDPPAERKPFSLFGKKSGSAPPSPLVPKYAGSEKVRSNSLPNMGSPGSGSPSLLKQLLGKSRASSSS